MVFLPFLANHLSAIFIHFPLRARADVAMESRCSHGHVSTPKKDQSLGKKGFWSNIAMFSQVLLITGRSVLGLLWCLSGCTAVSVENHGRTYTSMFNYVYSGVSENGTNPPNHQFHPEHSHYPVMPIFVPNPFKPVKKDTLLEPPGRYRSIICLIAPRKTCLVLYWICSLSGSM